jgi:hypothetical protein
VGQRCFVESYVSAKHAEIDMEEETTKPQNQLKASVFFLLLALADVPRPG